MKVRLGEFAKRSLRSKRMWKTVGISAAVIYGLSSVFNSNINIGAIQLPTLQQFVGGSQMQEAAESKAAVFSAKSQRLIPIDYLCGEGISPIQVPYYVSALGFVDEFGMPERTVVVMRTDLASAKINDPVYSVSIYDPATRIFETNGLGEQIKLGKNQEFGVVFAGDFDENAIYPLITLFESKNDGIGPQPQQLIEEAGKNRAFDKSFAALLIRSSLEICDMGSQPEILPDGQTIIYNKPIVLHTLTVRDDSTIKTFSDVRLAFSKEATLEGTHLVTGNIYQRSGEFFLKGVDENNKEFYFSLGISDDKLVWKQVK